MNTFINSVLEKIGDSEYQCFLNDPEFPTVSIYKPPFYFEVAEYKNTISFLIEKEGAEIIFCDDFNLEYLPLFLELGKSNEKI